MVAIAKNFSRTEWIAVAIILSLMLLLNILLPKEVFEPIFFLIAVLYLGFYALNSKHGVKVRIANAFIGGYFIARFLDSAMGFLSKLAVAIFS